MDAALDGALPTAGCRPRATRGRRSSLKAGVPEALARRIASLAALTAAPDIVLVADRAGKPIGEVAATYFAAESLLPARPRRRRGAGIVVSDYFDRLALDRALDSIGDAERRLTAAMVGNGAGRRRRGGGLGQAAAGRGRAHPRRDPRDRRLRADAVEADGGGEPAGGSGEAVARLTLPCGEGARASSAHGGGLQQS